MVALTLGLFSKALIASSLFSPTRTGSNLPEMSKVYYVRLLVGTAKISTLEKQNADCMTEKPN